MSVKLGSLMCEPPVPQANTPTRGMHVLNTFQLLSHACVVLLAGTNTSVHHPSARTLLQHVFYHAASLARGFCFDGVRAETVGPGVRILSWRAGGLVLISPCDWNATRTSAREM